MAETHLESPSEQDLPQWVRSLRGTQASVPLRVAIIGGGRACYHLLQILDTAKLSRLNMSILGVADVDPEAPGLRYARENGLPTTSRFQELYDLEGLNLIVELTGSQEAMESILNTKPSSISLLDHRGARFLWDLIQLETEKTQMQKHLDAGSEREKKHQQLILDSLPYRVMVVNQDMTINTVNQTFLRDKGLTYEDVLGKHCYEVRYGLNQPCAEYGRPCYLEEVKRDGGTISTIHEYVNEAGEERYDVITVSPILDEDGHIVQLLEASRDVTERIRLEKEVQKSNTFLQNMIQSTVDGIVVVDTKGNVLIFNEGMERLTGYSAKAIVEGGHLSDFYNIDVARENMKKMRSDQHGPLGKLNPTSMSITTKEGEEIPVTLSASLIEIEGQAVGSVGVFRDMREILKMRKDLEDAHFQLVQSEKIASVGRMAAGVAHEINNPLSGILIYAELLKESLKDDRSVAGDIQEIIDQTLRCKGIVSELLEFSRQSIGRTSAFSLDLLITKCLNLLVNQASFQDIEVLKEIDADIPQMVGDMGQLQQVFTNLFINAADAMEGKGCLSIRAEFHEDNNRFVITVSDTGPGIPEALRDKVLDIFFTTKPVGKGTGLGLSITQNIIHLHGGSLQFSCPPQGGTVFTIELPLETPENAVEEPVFIGLDE
jgi:PAS domain S-box-containing protein